MNPRKRPPSSRWSSSVSLRLTCVLLRDASGPFAIISAPDPEQTDAIVLIKLLPHTQNPTYLCHDSVCAGALVVSEHDVWVVINKELPESLTVPSDGPLGFAARAHRVLADIRDTLVLDERLHLTQARAPESGLARPAGSVQARLVQQQEGEQAHTPFAQLNQIGHLASRFGRDLVGFWTLDSGVRWLIVSAGFQFDWARSSNLADDFDPSSPPSPFSSIGLLRLFSLIGHSYRTCDLLLLLFVRYTRIGCW